MELARVHITQTPARTGIEQHRPQMSIRQRPAHMEIDQNVAGSLRISSTASRLYIDQTEAFADADLKGPLRRGTEYAAQARQNVMQYIANTMQQADQLQKIEHGTNAIADIARQNGERPPKAYNFATVPEHMGKVKIDFVPSELTIEADWPETEVSVQRHEPEIHIPRWETNTYLKQKNQISFSVAGGAVNRQL